MNKKRRVVFIALLCIPTMLVILIVLIAVFPGITFHLRPWDKTDLISLDREDLFGFVYITPPDREPATDEMLIRLIDGKQQKFNGTWTSRITDSGNAYIIETNPENKQRMFYVNGTEIHTLEIPGENDKVIDARENHSGTHVFLEFEKAGQTKFCFTETPTKDSSINCSQYLISNEGGKALWNPDNDRQALIRNDAGNEIVIYKPWDGEPPELFTSEDATDRYAELLSLFDNKTNDYRVIQTLPGLLITLVMGEVEIYRIPLRTTAAAWLSEDHILLKQAHQLDILELSTRRIANLTKQQNIGQSTITYRYRANGPFAGADREL